LQRSISIRLCKEQLNEIELPALPLSLPVCSVDSRIHTARSCACSELHQPGRNRHAGSKFVVHDDEEIEEEKEECGRILHNSNCFCQHAREYTCQYPGFSHASSKAFYSFDFLTVYQCDKGDGQQVSVFSSCPDTTFTRNGLGKYQLKGLPQIGIALVWQNEGRAVDDRGRCPKGRLQGSEQLDSFLENGKTRNGGTKV
jgi:hypothetical protein